LYVGRIHPTKGPDTAIRALAGCPPEATLRLQGRGDDAYIAELKALVSELGLDGRVSFAASARGELAPVYREADVLLFPSAWGEPFGLVPIEAMACATPVVATRDGGSAEYLRAEENCLAFEPGDADGLVGALHRLSFDEELRHRLVDRGLQTASTFTIDRFASDLELFHQQAILSAASSPARSFAASS
jgi:D-inositol-3-phosphate glycosyltransferase